MKYAVIELKGNQYKVIEGQELLVDKFGSDKAEFKVLLLVNDGKITVGKPVVKNASVKFRVINKEEKGEKINILKYRAKSRYRRKLGFRPQYTRLLIEKIS